MTFVPIANIKPEPNFHIANPVRNPALKVPEPNRFGCSVTAYLSRFDKFNRHPIAFADCQIFLSVFVLQL